MVYTCPMHPEIRQEGPGKCPLCGMDLVPENTVSKHTAQGSHNSHQTQSGFFKTYSPLFIIIGLILLVSLMLTLSSGHGLVTGMRYFMAGFFLVFSGFKFLDLPGFAEGYATYDLLARRIKAYGFVYPFLELGLGLAYATNFMPTATYWVTALLMSFSGLGVLQSLLAKRKFQCACLGTLIKVPLTQITLVEDFGMAAMAIAMLIF